MTEQELRAEIVEVCRRLHEQGLLSGADGNVSVKIGARVLITPAGRPKWRLSPEELAEIDMHGEILQGRPSSERLLHLEVYRSAPLAACVIHAHPPTAVAWSVARPGLTELPAGCLSEIIPAIGAIPIAPYACPGTAGMAERIHPLLPGHRAIILARHGALTWGESLTEALNGMERIEHSAKILKAAHELGGLTELPPEQIEELKALRARIGERLL